MSLMLSTPALLAQWQASLQWQPNAQQQDQFERLYQAIITANQQVNLTRLTTPDAFWEKHLWDAIAGLLPLRTFCPSLTGAAIDIGTGAGIPGIPAAILYPTLTLTLLDATEKKVAFLHALRPQFPALQLGAIAQRAEAVGQDANYRERFQLALIRAVAAPAVVAEYALPLVAIGGLAVLYQGQWDELQTQALQPVLQMLGGELVAVQAHQTPLTQSVRHYVYVRKIQPTPARYPRPIGRPTKSPLH